MKILDHTKELYQNGKFDMDDVQLIEQDGETSNYVITLKVNDERPEKEIHIFRSGCAIIPERNFHSMYLIIG